MKKTNKIFIFSIIIFITIVAILIINNILAPRQGELVKLDYAKILTKLEHQDDFILVVSKSDCSHCASYRPKLINIAKKYGVDIYYIEYDLETEEKREKFLKKLNLNGATPTTLFIKKGKETSLMDRLEGDLSEVKVIEKFKKMEFIEK